MKLPPAPRTRADLAEAVVADFLANQKARRPAVYFATIAHDDWCPLLRGGSCTCTPNVSFREIAEGADRGRAPR